MNNSYVVWGDLSSEKSSENYPTKVLCDDCIGDFEIVSTGGPSKEPCEECGAEAEGNSEEG